MNCPIGLFDSGVGGLTVWRQVAPLLPHHDLIYLADQAHCPYGSRPVEEIRQLAIRATGFLLQHEARVIVVACNTASAAALELLRETWPEVPFIGMEPAIKPAAAASRARKIGLLATHGTLAGSLFAHTLERLSPGVQVITRVPAGVVERIEMGDVDSPELETRLRAAVGPLREEGVDEIVLGCTHYPLAAGLIQRIAGEGVRLVDPSEAVARQVERIVLARGWQEAGGEGARRFYSSGDPALFAQALEKLLGLRAPVESSRP